MNYIWDKIVQYGSSEIVEDTPLKHLKCFKFFKGCLPKISLGPFLNTLSHMYSCLLLPICDTNSKI